MQSQERTHQCTRVSRGTGCKCHFSWVCELKTADQKTFKTLSAFSPHQAVVKGQQQTGLLTITAIMMKGKKPWKDHSDHRTNVETRMKGLWIWKSWTYLEEDGARQKSASRQSSEFSNFSICQRESGGRALASVISSDCFSTTHQAAVTAPSGTVNLSLWGFQQRWRPRVTRIKMGHFEVDRCSIN